MQRYDTKNFCATHTLIALNLDDVVARNCLTRAGSRSYQGSPVTIKTGCHNRARDLFAVETSAALTGPLKTPRTAWSCRLRAFIENNQITNWRWSIFLPLGTGYPLLVFSPRLETEALGSRGEGGRLNYWSARNGLIPLNGTNRADKTFQSSRGIADFLLAVRDRRSSCARLGPNRTIIPRPSTLPVFRPLRSGPRYTV